MHVAPNKAKIPGVRTKYKLNGNDHTKAISINNCLYVIEAMIAKQAGRNNIKNVVTIGSVSFSFEK
jgi:hypothetical protein